MTRLAEIVIYSLSLGITIFCINLGVILLLVDGHRNGTEIKGRKLSRRSNRGAFYSKFFLGIFIVIGTSRLEYGVFLQ